MPKPKLALFSRDLPNCPCFQTIFDTEFESRPTGSEIEFLQTVQQRKIDAAVVCFCSTHEKDAEDLLRLEALTGPVPIVTCSAQLKPSFVAFAARHGVDRFLCCTMGKGRIQDILFETIRRGGLQEFLEFCCPGSLETPYMKKIIREIVHSFPHRFGEAELGERLQISRSWLKKLFQQSFGKPFTRVMRRIWIHQALRMMQYTDLDNTEIALQLNFSEESNMARDFRKELGYSPSEARHRLSRHSPRELLK